MNYKFIFSKFLAVIALIVFYFLFIPRQVHSAPQLTLNLPDDTICPYTDPNLSYTSYLTAGANEQWIYNWFFENGDPATDSGNNPNTEWKQEGSFQITLKAYKHLIFGSPDPIDSVIKTKTIVIDATCCSGLTSLTSAVISSNGTPYTYDEVYIVDSDITIPSNYDITITGTVLFDASITTTTPGGTVNDTYITVNSSTELNIEGASLRGFCNRMWGGIEMGDDTKLFMDEAYVSDCFEGIYDDPTSTSPYTAQVEDCNFINNQKGIRIKDVDATSGDNYFLRNTFDCDPEDYLEPLIYDSGHNKKQWYRTEYGLNIYGDSDFDPSYLDDNSFKNGMIGIEINATSSNTITMYTNAFELNQIMGLYCDSIERLNANEVCTYVLPTSVDDHLAQYDSVISRFPNLPSGTVFGVAGENIRQINLDDSEFIADPDNTDYDFTSDVDRTAVYAHFNQFSMFNTDIFMDISHVESMNYGMHYAGIVNHLNIEDNIFKDNEYNLYIDGASGSGPEPELNCNNFIKSNKTEDIQTYGIYIVDGSPNMGDIGGDFINVFNDPSGNGWPSDSTGGYPSTTNGSGGIPDVYNWSPPNLWYSIYDANADYDTTTTLGYHYYRYTNEFIGEDTTTFGLLNDAIWPTDLIRIADNYSGDESTCTFLPEIPFPQDRISSGLSEDLHETRLYPNPFNSHVRLEGVILNDQSSLEVYDMIGKKVLSKEINTNDVQIDVSELRRGTYLFQISDSKKLLFRQIMIKH